MSQPENVIPPRARRPRWTLDEFSSTCLFGAATLFAAFAIVCRWLVALEGQVLQWWLIAGGLTAALMVLRRIRIARLAEIITMGVFGVTALTALCLWSPGLAFAVLVSLPLVLASSLPWCLFALGYELQRADSGHRPAAGSTSQGSIASAVDPQSLPAPLISEASRPLPATTTGEALTGNEDSGVDESGDEETDDPWLAVQHQFEADAALEQNITQWQQQDGTRSLVANVRCRFRSAQETVVVHLPFWPLLNHEPQVFCRVASGPEAVVKVTQQRPHGLRLEVRLSDRNLATPLADVIVEVIASASNGSTENAA